MIKRFLNYVEIQTKITSLFTFTLTIGFMLHNGFEIKVFPTIIFFFSMLIFDLCTTAINNYIDSKTNGQDIGFSRRAGLIMIYVMFIVSALLGLYLVYISDVIVLLMGMFCFAVGVLYTYGPVPISRQPYGEIISGILYGYFIPFIMIHVSSPHSMIEVMYLDGFLSLNFDLIALAGFVLVFMVPTLLTSSIMLANNTCDIEKDVLVKRYTLPYYLGQSTSVKLMYTLYIFVFTSIILSSLLGLVPLIAILSILVMPLVWKNVAKFKKDLVKHVSFVFIIKNFILIMAVYSALVLVGSLLF